MKFVAALLVCGWASSQAQTHTIRAGTLLDGRGNVLPNQTIEVVEGKVTSIGTSTSKPDIDLSSYTVMPGWIGACLPISDGNSLVEDESNAYRLLKNGFTTVISSATQFRDLIDDRRWAGPRILSHGNCADAESFFELARYGPKITPDALANVTSRAAEKLGIADRTGSVAPGMLADFVATRGNPLEDASAVHAVVFVMKEGHVYREPPAPPRKLLLRDGRLY